MLCVCVDGYRVSVAFNLPNLFRRYFFLINLCMCDIFFLFSRSFISFTFLHRTRSFEQHTLFAYTADINWEISRWQKSRTCFEHLWLNDARLFQRKWIEWASTRLLARARASAKKMDKKNIINSMGRGEGVRYRIFLIFFFHRMSESTARCDNNICPSRPDNFFICSSSFSSPACKMRWNEIVDRIFKRCTTVWHLS